MIISLRHKVPEDQRGAAAVELTLLVPALLLVLGLLVAGGRLWFARTTVNEAAQSAARAASLARSAGAATTASRDAGAHRPRPTALRINLGLDQYGGLRGTSRDAVNRQLDDLVHGGLLRRLPSRLARLHPAHRPRIRRPRHLSQPVIMKKSIMKLATAQDERGQSLSLFVLVIMGALIITAGLVIDGGQKVTATSRAESAAAGASRAAGNAAATQQLGGADAASAAVLAAKTYLAGQPGVDGTVSVSNGVVLVTTSANEPTILLSVIGIGSVSARGSAQANIVPTGDAR